jgi:sRNA-binding carbon storage regulator CsrA
VKTTYLLTCERAVSLYKQFIHEAKDFVVFLLEANKVRLGIEASPEIQVHREEVFRAIKNKEEPVGV